MLNKIILTTLLIFIFTIILNHVKNKSNFSKFIIIPIIVSLLTKYIIGDFDSGYTWSIRDIFYWFYIFTLSYMILLCM